MRRSVRYAATALAALFFGVACTTPCLSTAVDVNATAWSDAARLSLVNSDTTTLRDIGVFLRYNDRFIEDTLTVRIGITSPDLLSYEELFRITIPTSDSPAAVQHETATIYRHRAILSQEGHYNVTITPVRPVRGIEAVGITIEKSN